MSRVSVIIPCYNAASWIAEAIDSCLAQTHRDTEIVVIDDGSTDATLRIIKSYGAKLRFETGAHHGGNQARNRGFALASGDFIQFLDADDFLLPEKLAQQVHFLAETGADGVYGDWRHQFHTADDRVSFGEIKHSGMQDDLIESLLAGWWVAPVALLFRREIVSATGGWDEGLRAAQDRDFFLSVVLAGADVRYQPGCQAIYRRYGNVTVSTSNRQVWLESHLAVLAKAERALQDNGRLTDRYRRALANSYFSVARSYYDSDRERYRRLLDKALQLSPAVASRQSRLYRTIQRTLGFALAERLASYKRRVRTPRP